MAFQKAIEILSGASSDIDRSAAPVSASNRMSPDGRESGTEKLARKLPASPDAIGEIYCDNEQGGVDVVVGVGKLDDSTATASKQLALLVAGGRQISEVEQWTSSKDIRNVCVYYGRFDSSNFAKCLKQMDDAFSFRGKGSQLEVRLHQRGIDKLKQLIGNLTGGT